jgi:hypothetical protein
LQAFRSMMLIPMSEEVIIVGGYGSGEVRYIRTISTFSSRANKDGMPQTIGDESQRSLHVRRNWLVYQLPWDMHRLLESRYVRKFEPKK